MYLDEKYAIYNNIYINYFSFQNNGKCVLKFTITLTRILKYDIFINRCDGWKMIPTSFAH